MRAILAGEVAAQIDDGVADELSGAVIGDVAATVDLVQLDVARGELLVGGDDVFAMRVAAEGEDGEVLEQQQRVADEALLARIDDATLDGEAVGVGDAPELEEVEVLIAHASIIRLGGAAAGAGRR